MNQHSLTNEWKIWFSYLTEEQQKQNKYGSNLNKVHTIKTVEDLVYIWKQSYVSSLNNFFIFNQGQGLQNWKYEIDSQLQIVNSINYFKGQIEPSWEDKVNENCGALVFQIERAQENYQEIYEALVFYFLGEDFENNERINGIRFISAKPNHIAKSFYRVQIWVNFNDTDIDKVKDFRGSFEPFLEQYHIHNLKPFFKNHPKK